jgi:hypothetical protein
MIGLESGMRSSVPFKFESDQSLKSYCLPQMPNRISAWFSVPWASIPGIGNSGSGAQAPNSHREHVRVTGNAPQAFGAGSLADQGALARQIVQCPTQRTQHPAGRRLDAVDPLRQLQTTDRIGAVSIACMALQQSASRPRAQSSSSSAWRNINFT